MSVISVALLSDMAAIPSPSGKSAFVADPGREGIFQFRSGDYTAAVNNDPLRGLYVESLSVPKGQGCWVRVWDKINGYPEWWGARPNDFTFDSLPALQAAVAACPVLHLAKADYLITDTWVVAQSYRKIIGQGSNSYASGQGTRIVLTNAAKDVMFAGLAADPGDTTLFIRQLKIENINLMHASAAIPPTGDHYTAGAGLRTNCLFLCSFNNVAAWECSIGFAIHGNIATKYVDCQSFRSIVGTSPTNDIWRGFWLRGLDPVTGAAGGNASLHLERCIARMGGSPALVNPVGFKIEGGFVDSFLTFCETTAVPTGMHVQGTGANGAASSNIDLHIVHPIIDQCDAVGLLVDGLAPAALVEIDHPYIGCNSATLAGIYLQNSAGRTSVIGGQIVAADSGTPVTPNSAIGVFAQNASGLTVSGLKLSNLGRPMVLEGLKAARLAPDITNVNNSANPSQAAIHMANCSRVVVAPTITGKAAAFPKGVELAANANSRIEIAATLIDPACLATANQKIVINGGAITTAGASGTHLVTGIMS